MEDTTVVKVVEKVNRYGVEYVQKLVANDAAPCDLSGRAVAISADKNILVVGAYGVDEGGTDTGSVYIYKRDAGLDTYNPTHIQKLVASDRAAFDYFGISVAISADKSILIVGAQGVNNGGIEAGAVYIYKRDAGLDTYNHAHIQKLTASDRATWDQFGFSISISADKSILVVGAIEDDDGGDTEKAGTVYIYKRDAGLDTYNPAHIQKLTASDRATLDMFGTSVTISADKSILIVGVQTNEYDTEKAGSVYIYRQNVGADTYDPEHVQKLNASDGASRDWFGASIIISDDKSLLVVGAPGVDAGNIKTGSVYIYRQNVGADTYDPEHVQKLNASDGASRDWFGSAVSLSVDKSMLIVGASGDDEGNKNTGSVYIYQQLSVIEDN